VLLVIRMKTRQKLDMRLMGLVSIFEEVTKVNAVDFLENKGQLVFLVKEDDGKKAVGKNGMHAKKLTYRLQKKVRIIVLSADVKTFIEQVIRPLEPVDIEDDGITCKIKMRSVEEKARLIGRGGSNIEFLKGMVEHHYKRKVMAV